MSLSFEFNAPQFLNKSEDPEADRFFDMDSEVHDTEPFKPDVEKHVSEDSGIENKDPSTCEMLQPNGDGKLLTTRKVLCEIVVPELSNNETKHIKGSVSTGNGKELIRNLERLNISENKPYSVTKHMTTNEAVEQNLTKNDQFEPSGSSKHSFSCYNQRTIAVKRKGSPFSPAKKFISLAERVQHFHYDTPDRFRTKPKHCAVQNVKQRQTIPKTPVLTARYRCRPVNFPNEKEREEQELNEIKKHQIKAHPLNEKILKGPVLNLKVPIEKRPSTVPAPFKLTEIKKKEQPESPVFVFKAQPVPTIILSGTVGVPPKKVVRTTVPLTPNIRVPVKFTNELDATPKATSLEQSVRMKTTKVQPFSFDHKIKELYLRKQENFKKVLEEEKKGFNSFKAHPLPTYLGKAVCNSSLNKTSQNNSSLSTPFGCKIEKESKNVVEPAFKAKPASIIHQKPFVPILPKHKSILPDDVNLNTEKRAIDRQKFDEKIKKKEETLAQILKERKEEEEKLEQQKKLEERKLTQFKANPLPNYKPFKIIPSDSSNLTLPKTPRCLSRIRSESK